MKENEHGFTLIELLTAMALSAILLTLGAASIRHFWMVQALQGAVDEVSSQLKRAQSRSVSESRLVYGAWFERGSSQWRLVAFDPGGATTTTDDTCGIVETPKSLGTGMFSASVRISADSTLTAFADSHETTVCRSDLTATSAVHQFVFFYPRGTATAGKVTIEQPSLGRSRAIDVRGLTGRVDAA